MKFLRFVEFSLADVRIILSRRDAGFDGFLGKGVFFRLQAPFTAACPITHNCERLCPPM